MHNALITGHVGFNKNHGVNVLRLLMATVLEVCEGVC
jgi:hypothetical protein